MNFRGGIRTFWPEYGQDILSEGDNMSYQTPWHDLPRSDMDDSLTQKMHLKKT